MTEYFLLSKYIAFNNVRIVIVSYLHPRGIVYLLLLQGIKEEPWHVAIMTWNRILPEVHCLNIIKSKIQLIAYTCVRAAHTYLLGHWISVMAVSETLDNFVLRIAMLLVWVVFLKLSLQHSAAHKQMKQQTLTAGRSCDYLDWVFKGSQIWNLLIFLCIWLTNGCNHLWPVNLLNSGKP